MLWMWIADCAMRAASYSFCLWMKEKRVLFFFFFCKWLWLKLGASAPPPPRGATEGMMCWCEHAIIARSGKTDGHGVEEVKRQLGMDTFAIAFGRTGIRKKGIHGAIHCMLFKLLLFLPVLNKVFHEFFFPFYWLLRFWAGCSRVGVGGGFLALFISNVNMRIATESNRTGS